MFLKSQNKVMRWTVAGHMEGFIASAKVKEFSTDAQMMKQGSRGGNIPGTSKNSPQRPAWRERREWFGTGLQRSRGGTDQVAELYMAWTAQRWPSCCQTGKMAICWHSRFSVQQLCQHLAFSPVPSYRSNTTPLCCFNFPHSLHPPAEGKHTH